MHTECVVGTLLAGWYIHFTFLIQLLYVYTKKAQQKPLKLTSCRILSIMLIHLTILCGQKLFILCFYIVHFLCIWKLVEKQYKSNLLCWQQHIHKCMSVRENVQSETMECSIVITETGHNCIKMCLWTRYCF